MTVSGAPAGFTPGEIGAGACPDTGPPNQACSAPQYAFVGPNHTYTLTLSPGRWVVAGFYETSGFGGAFLGTSVVVDVPSGGTVVQNFGVRYSPPSELTGSITVTGVPPADPVQQFLVLLCPSYAPYNGTNQSLACVNGYAAPPSPGATSANYQITGLPPGNWTAYPGFCALSGCGTNAQAGVAVTLRTGGTTRANLTTSFLLPGQALLSGSVTVLNTPSDFSDPVGVNACETGSSTCQTFYVPSGNRFDLVVKAGTYTVSGFYVAAPFDNSVDGPSHSVTLAAGNTRDINLSVTYSVPGSAVGRIRVDGPHPGVNITAYTVLACPTTKPWNGGLPAPQCVSEYSGQGGFGYGSADRIAAPQGPASGTRPPAGFSGAPMPAPYNRYLLSLTSGQWTLYPGYQSVFGSVIDHTGTTISIASGRVTHRNLALLFQRPTQAALTGAVDVVGAPANSFQSGVRACTAAPTTTTCDGEQEAFSGPNGTYTLLLTPGTWWVQGLVDVYFGFSSNQSTSSPAVVHADAGSVTREDFVVTVSQ